MPSLPQLAFLLVTNNPTASPTPASIVAGLELALANSVEFGERLANRAIRGQQEAMGTMRLIRRVRHGTKRGIFLIHFRGRNHVVALIVGNVCSPLFDFHKGSLRHSCKIINADLIILFNKYI
jgi:hypothetical protein